MKKFQGLIILCPYCDGVAVMDLPEDEPPEDCPLCGAELHGGHMTVDAVDLRTSDAE